MHLMRTPRSLDLEITGRCNLRCSYCSHFESAGDVEEALSTEEWLTFFEELSECRVMDVCLQGGEPFIREDIEELILGIVRNKMRFSALSNGTLITDRLAGFLARTARCDSVQVSIDSAEAENHDAFRGDGAFTRAMDGLLNLLKHDVPATVRVTIHRRNVRDLERIAGLLLDDLKLPGFSLNAASHFGLCRQNAARVQLTAEDRTLAMKSLSRLSSKYGTRISATAGPLKEAQMWRSMEEARRAGLPGLPGCGRLTACTGPMTKLAVRADGMMIPCGHLPGMVLGEINQDSLGAVWRDHPELNRFRTRRDISLDEFEECRECPYMPYCRGGCPALADTLVGDPYKPSPDSCYKRFLDDGGSLPDIVGDCD